MADNDNLGRQNPGFMAPLTRAQSPVMLPLHDPNDPNNGGTADGAQPGAGGANTNQNGGAAAGAQPVAGAGGAGAGEKTFSFKEDRSDWIPRNRLNEVSGKFTEAEKRALKAEADLESERKRTRALAGLEPEDPKAKDTEEIKAALLGMFPGLSAIQNLTPDQLQEVMEAAQTARNSSQSSWARHAATMLNDLESDVAQQIGAVDGKLTPTQKRNLQRSYREEAQQSVIERQAAMKRGERETLETLPSDNDFLARHEAGDKTLLKEFAKAFLGDWFEPARRSVTAQQARRSMRPVPRGERSRQIPAAGAPKVDLNNKDDFKKALLAARGASE